MTTTDDAASWATVKNFKPGGENQVTTPVTLTIELPHPPKALHPNRKPNRYEKTRKTKEARDTGRIVATSVRYARDANYGDSLPMAAAKVSAVFYYDVRRERDRDNLAAWIKAYIDGCADAGIVSNDSQLSSPVCTIKVDKQKAGTLELTFVECEVAELDE